MNFFATHLNAQNNSSKELLFSVSEIMLQYDGVDPGSGGGKLVKKLSKSQELSKSCKDH